MRSVTSVIILLVSSLLCGDAFAQQRADEPVFGKGRFLKRLRDEVFGSSQTNPNTAKRQVPTPAAKGKTPTPAPNAQNRKPNSRTGSRSQFQRPPGQPYSRQPVAGQPQPPSRQPTRQTEMIGSGSDFGLQLTTNQNDDLVVQRVDPRGNAARAGIRPGDVIRQIGGVDVTSLEEFDSISEAMGPGDQLEFEIQSRGSKSRKLLIQYGSIEKEPSSDVAQSNRTKPHNQEGLQSVLDNRYSRTSAANTRPPQPPRSRYASPNSQQSRWIIERQQRQIEQLQQQLRQLRNQRPAASGPALNGPGN